jgi:D-alanyl-D-alanine carboxypeptidase (penicillin-binding protein 5/6)
MLLAHWNRTWQVSALVVFLALPQIRAAENDLSSQLRPLIHAHQGQVAVAIKHLETGESFEWRADQPMPTASLIKFPIMIEAYRQADAGTIDLDARVELSSEDKVPGSGVLTPHFAPGLSLSLRDAIRLMIVFSDNTATNLVLSQIGIGATASTMEQWALPNTKVHAMVFRREPSAFPERSREFGLGSTTANETLQLYERLHRKELVSATASAEMLDHLLACDDEAKLTRFLPPGTKVAHKSGSVSAARCDAGIVFSPSGPYAICVLTNDNKDHSWQDDNQGNRLCADISRRTYEYFNPHIDQAAESVDETLAIGAAGRLVEDLQRTLNLRLEPSADLEVDGDFGPLTQAAVIRFQTQEGISPDGEVGSETWKALGDLVTSEPPVPTPNEVNSEQLDRQPPDDLRGQPFVTCKAWAIADGESGDLLWGSSQDQKLDIASTTKVMTAFVVLKGVEEDPKLLDEVVTFSARADGTLGSTAGVRAGEQLSVRELLFGLLLPSGNDASVAFAEHFGGRFQAPADGPDQNDPLPRFVAEMNRTAQALGMENTRYRNPHGLTEEGHQSTASDLLRLAHAAFAMEAFRDYVATRQYGCTVVGKRGYTRNVVWKNTNRLLPIQGYDGVKTGTTRNAGACLISSARRDDDHLLMVVLGATSTEARYVDTRNLYRWAWQQRKL